MPANRFSRSLGIFVLLLLLPSLSLAQGRGPQFRGGRGPMDPMPFHLERLAKELNLTDDQVASLKNLREAFMRDTLEWRNDLLVKRLDLQDLMRQPEADSDQILNRQREVSALESKIQERMVLFQLDIRKVLTPEQIKLLPPGWGPSGFGKQRMMRGPGHGSPMR